MQRCRQRPELGGVATFTVTLSEITGEEVTVNLGFSGTASGGGADYSASATQLILPPGTLSDSITVTAVRRATIGISLMFLPAPFQGSCCYTVRR